MQRVPWWVHSSQGRPRATIEGEAVELHEMPVYEKRKKKEEKCIYWYRDAIGTLRSCHHLYTDIQMNNQEPKIINKTTLYIYKINAKLSNIINLNYILS